MDKNLRDAKIIRGRLKGKSTMDIAKEVPCAQNTVIKVLNSQEAKDTIERARVKILSLADMAVDVVLAAMEDKTANMNQALKAAIAVLESAGAVSKNLKVEHDYPKPTIIRRVNGEEYRIGVITHDADFSKVDPK